MKATISHFAKPKSASKWETLHIKFGDNWFSPSIDGLPGDFWGNLKNLTLAAHEVIYFPELGEDMIEKMKPLQKKYDQLALFLLLSQNVWTKEWAEVHPVIIVKRGLGQDDLVVGKEKRSVFEACFETSHEYVSKRFQKDPQQMIQLSQEVANATKKPKLRDINTFVKRYYQDMKGSDQQIDSEMTSEIIQREKISSLGMFNPDQSDGSVEHSDSDEVVLSHQLQEFVSEIIEEVIQREKTSSLRMFNPEQSGDSVEHSDFHEMGLS